MYCLPWWRGEVVIVSLFGKLWVRIPNRVSSVWETHLLMHTLKCCAFHDLICFVIAFIEEKFAKTKLVCLLVCLLGFLNFFFKHCMKDK
jgi:hypothetical protein